MAQFSLPPPNWPKTWLDPWPQLLDRSNPEGSMTPNTNLAPSATRLALPNHHRHPSAAIRSFQLQIKASLPKPNHCKLGSNDHYDSRLWQPLKLRASTTTFVSKRGEGWRVDKCSRRGCASWLVCKIFYHVFFFFFLLKRFTKFYKVFNGHLKLFLAFINIL